jgi:uncharacterized alkaline shock family protein YloU
MPQPSSAASAIPAARVSDTSPAAAERISAGDGKITVAQGVVQKIAGIACREISGVHAMGASTSRAFAVERMTGLDVVEVNINVDDLYLPDSGDQNGDTPARVS